jgi:hypothetical protein
VCFLGGKSNFLSVNRPNLYKHYLLPALPTAAHKKTGIAISGLPVFLKEQY